MSESALDSEFVDEAVASFGATPHFGDPSGEQWALESGRALVRRPDLAVISVSGADRLTWLTSLASQVVIGLVPGAGRSEREPSSCRYVRRRGGRPRFRTRAMVSCPR